jgi:hypothetical protein
MAEVWTVAASAPTRDRKGKEDVFCEDGVSEVGSVEVERSAGRFGDLENGGA